MRKTYLLVAAAVIVAGVAGAVVLFGADEPDLDAEAAEECRIHAIARALDDDVLDEFNRADGWRVHSVSHGYVDVVARQGALYQVSGTLSVRATSGSVTSEDYVCRLARTEQGAWRLLELTQPTP